MFALHFLAHISHIPIFILKLCEKHGPYLSFIPLKYSNIEIYTPKYVCLPYTF